MFAQHIHLTNARNPRVCVCVCVCVRVRVCVCLIGLNNSLCIYLHVNKYIQHQIFQDLTVS